MKFLDKLLEIHVLNNKTNLNKLFTIYILLFLFLTFAFFAVGYIGVSYRMVQDLAGIQDGTLQHFAPAPDKFGVLTMTPLFITTAIEICLWVYFITVWISKKPEFTYKIIAMYTLIMGLSIWFYSIF